MDIYKALAIRCDR